MRGLIPARVTLGTALLVVLAGCKSTARTGEVEAAGQTSAAAADPTLIEPLLADDLVYYGLEPFTKQHLMAHVRDTSFTLASVSQHELRVRVLGSARDVAVATGSVNAKGRRAGEAFDLRNHYTEVWVKRGGRWQCVAGQEVTWPVKGQS